MQNRVALGASFYATYSEKGERSTLFSLNGREIARIAHSGYPVIYDDTIRMVGIDRSSLSRVDQNGELLWRHQFTSPLLDIAMTEATTIAGMANGEIRLIDRMGGNNLLGVHHNSRFDFVSAVDISEDGRRAVAVAGLYRQYLLLFDLEGDARSPLDDDIRADTPLFSEPRMIALASDYRRTPLLAIAPSGEYAVVEQPSGLLVVEFATGMTRMVALSAPPLGVAINERVSAIVTGRGSIDLMLLAFPDIVLGRYRIDSAAPHLNHTDTPIVQWLGDRVIIADSQKITGIAITGYALQ